MREQQDIPVLLLIVTELCLMLQVSKGTSGGKLLFTQGMILIAKNPQNQTSTEFKGMPLNVWLKNPFWAYKFTSLGLKWYEFR